MPAADFAAAQQRIAARRALRSKQHEPSSPWRMLAGRSGTRPAFRVGQVDAELLDAELIDLLKSQVGDGLKFFGSHLTDTYAAEILLALRLVLFKLSIWNNNASYGAHLQGLRYSDARSSAPNHPPPKPWQKVAYGFVTVGARYAWTKWQDYLLAADDDPPHRVALVGTRCRQPRLFPRLPRQRPLPHPHRPPPAPAPDANLALGLARGVL
jgi:peroxin-2